MSQWLYRRGKGKILHYRFEINGVPYTGSTKTADLSAAKQILEIIRRDCVLGEHGIRKAPTLGTIARSWLDTRGKGRSAAHRRAARQSLEALGDLRKLPLTHLTTTRMDGWQATYLENHSEASANLVLRYLKLWCRWAMSQKLIKELPYDTKPVRQQQRDRPVVNLDRVDEFLAAIDQGAINPQVPAAVRFAMMMGLRESEVLGARWDWIRDGYYLVGGRTKSRKLRRVKIPQELLTAIGWMVLAQRLPRPRVGRPLGEAGPEPLPSLGLIFPGKSGKPHVQGWLRQALHRGANELGLDHLGMHRLRATFATLHLRAGKSLKTVMTMLGHADIRTTAIYQEVSLEEQAQAQDELWAKRA